VNRRELGGAAERQRVWVAARRARATAQKSSERLILQPQVEVNLYSKADPVRTVGAGFSDIDTGLRLRYEFSRKFAPYLGIVYEGKFGQSASLARRAGESTGDVRFVFGIHTWF
jgi:copper resistance protein B